MSAVTLETVVQLIEANNRALAERIDALGDKIDQRLGQLPCKGHAEAMDQINTRVDEHSGQIRELVNIKAGVNKVLVALVGIGGPALTAGLMKLFHL